MSRDLIPDYDELTVGDVEDFVADHTLTADQIDRIEAYEAAHKDRKTVYPALDEARADAPEPAAVTIIPSEQYVAGYHFDDVGVRETVEWTPRLAQALDRPEYDRPFEVVAVHYDVDVYEAPESVEGVELESASVAASSTPDVALGEDGAAVADDREVREAHVADSQLEDEQAHSGSDVGPEPDQATQPDETDIERGVEAVDDDLDTNAAADSDEAADSGPAQAVGEDAPDVTDEAVSAEEAATGDGDADADAETADDSDADADERDGEADTDADADADAEAADESGVGDDADADEADAEADAEDDSDADESDEE